MLWREQEGAEALGYAMILNYDKRAGDGKIDLSDKDDCLL